MKIRLIIFIGFLFAQDAPFFNGELAFQFLKEQCDIGPRFPGSQGHLKTKEYFKNYLIDKSHHLEIMDERIKHPYKDKMLDLTNFMARFYPDRDNRIMFMAHWDTREIADKDPIETNRNKPILGANDGASGIAILMVLADILFQNPLNNIGVDLLFLDGEDMGESGDPSGFGLGTLEFTKNMPKPLPKYAICLDMVADAEPSFKMEPFSLQQAPWLVYKVWEIANNMGYSEFSYKIGNAVYDDHRVLYLNSGIPSIDIIDFEYPNADLNYWHTLNDIPENCSARTLEIVGNVVTTLIFIEDNE
tara:strand:+ start:3781 stop:4689 length:909 start_codon:yes stop_codon:yes gene_type:complete